MAKIIAICRSEKKGTKKEAVNEGVIRGNYGLMGDAHADCCSHRQVSLLARESIDKMRALGLDIGPGDFAENLTTEGIDVAALPLGTRISIGKEVILEITQIGKDCHNPCAIYRQVGVRVMPREGVFARVIRGGVIRAEDRIKIGR